MNYSNVAPVNSTILWSAWFGLVISSMDLIGVGRWGILSSRVIFIPVIWFWCIITIVFLFLQGERSVILAFWQNYWVLLLNIAGSRSVIYYFLLGFQIFMCLTYFWTDGHFFRPLVNLFRPRYHLRGFVFYVAMLSHDIYLVFNDDDKRSNHLGVVHRFYLLDMVRESELPREELQRCPCLLMIFLHTDCGIIEHPSVASLVVFPSPWLKGYFFVLITLILFSTDLINIRWCYKW